MLGFTVLDYNVYLQTINIEDDKYNAKRYIARQYRSTIPTTSSEHENLGVINFRCLCCCRTSKERREGNANYVRSRIKCGMTNVVLLVSTVAYTPLAFYTPHQKHYICELPYQPGLHICCFIIGHSLHPLFVLLLP